MHTIKGNILDAITKQPVVGANVFVSDAQGQPISAKATQTNHLGTYNLMGVKLNEFITFSMAGYKQETTLASNASGTIYFEPSLASLQDGKTLFSKERGGSIALALAGLVGVWAWQHRAEIENYFKKQLKS